MITINKFLQITGFSERDSYVAIKIYSGIEMKESDWVNELKGKFVFNIIKVKKNKK